jgi:hypothetical protein
MHHCIARYARFKGIVRCVSNHTRLLTYDLIQERIGVHNLRGREVRDQQSNLDRE